MNRKLIITVALIAACMGIMIYAGSNKPEEIDWTPYYSIDKKTPLGLYVFDKETPALFKGQQVKKINETPYEYFDPLYDYKAKAYNAEGVFMNISGKNTMDEVSARELAYFAAHGNTVFLAMKNFPPKILDTLKIQMKEAQPKSDSVRFNVTRWARSHYFRRGLGYNCFDSLPDGSQVLGQQQIAGKNYANFVRVPFGNGYFVLHTQPAIFSNYHLLKSDHHLYAAEVLSVLPDETVYWQTGLPEREQVSSGPLRYIMSQPGLRWAYWTGLLALLVFILFNAKRKQRIVPETEPVRNSTVDFARTIGNLYYLEGNHHTIIEKKIIYFLEHVRNEYHVDTYDLDEAFVEKLHAKTGKPVEDIQKAVSLIKYHRQQLNSTEADVAAINKAIENLRL